MQSGFFQWTGRCEEGKRQTCENWICDIGWLEWLANKLATHTHMGQLLHDGLAEGMKVIRVEIQEWRLSGQ